LPISHAGAFVFWIEYDGPTGERIKGREGYFNVDPVLRVKARTPILSKDLKPLPVSEGGKILAEDVALPLDGLVILTVVSKWMGTLDEWRAYLKDASEHGYNMIHYTPLQQAGESGSPYSIADQLSFDKKIIGDVSKEEGIEKMKETLRIARDEFGLLSLTDVVMNHTANNSPWLLEHPEAGKPSSPASPHPNSSQVTVPSTPPTSPPLSNSTMPSSTSPQVSPQWVFPPISSLPQTSTSSSAVSLPKSETNSVFGSITFLIASRSVRAFLRLLMRVFPPGMDRI